MRDDLEKSIMEIGEPFTKEEVADMMAVACDPETGKINYEHYINLLIVRKSIQLGSILLRFLSLSTIKVYYILSKKRRKKTLRLPLEIKITGENSRRA